MKGVWIWDASAWLAQSVEHETLTANFRGSKQSQGRGFEPHIGRTFGINSSWITRRVCCSIFMYIWCISFLYNLFSIFSL